MGDNKQKDNEEPRYKTKIRLAIMAGFFLLGFIPGMIVIKAPTLFNKDWPGKPSMEEWSTYVRYCGARGGTYIYSWEDYELLYKAPSLMQRINSTHATPFMKSQVCCDHKTFKICKNKAEVWKELTGGNMNNG